MNMTGYTKLFGSIVASTIWREPHTVRIVWITMLALANKNGIVEASIPGLADLSRVTLDEVQEALQALQAPDEFSRTPDFEGRRIEKHDGGWRILNHAKYRAKMGIDERREYLKLKKREERAAKPKRSTRESTNVNTGRDPSTPSTHTEAKAHSYSEAKTKAVSADALIESLRDNAAYKGIDIDREFAKMKLWMNAPKGKGRKLTRTFIIRWLNKVEPSLLTEEPQERPGFRNGRAVPYDAPSSI